MSKGPSHMEPSDDTWGESNLNDRGHVSENHFPWDIPCDYTMLHVLQIKGLYGGKARKDQYVHLGKFLEVCTPFNIPCTTKVAFRLYLFPFLLTGKALLWFHSLPTNSITSWSEITRIFLDQYSHPSKVHQIRDKIVNFIQRSGEPFYKYGRVFIKN